MASNGNRDPIGNLMDKLRSFFSPQDPRKNKTVLPPKARFSIWYFLLAVLLVSYLQAFFFSAKVETIPYSLGLVSYERPRQPMFLPESFSPGKNYSEAKAAQIDEEVTRIVEEVHQRVRKIVSERRTVLDDLAHLLTQKESVQGEELRKMLSATTPGMATSSPGQPSRNITEKGKNEKWQMMTS